MQLQFTLHLHFVFYRNECAQPECGVFFTTSPPHARCLTLTLAPDGAGPGSLPRLATAHLQLPLAYPRARFHTSPRSNVFMPGNDSGCSMLARASGINVSRYRGTIIELLVASLLSCGVRRHDDALICVTCHAHNKKSPPT